MAMKTWNAINLAGSSPLARSTTEDLLTVLTSNLLKFISSTSFGLRFARLCGLSCDFKIKWIRISSIQQSVDHNLSESMALSVNIELSESMGLEGETPPLASKQSEQSGQGKDIHSDLERGAAPAAEELEVETDEGFWPDFLVDILLPEVPPGNLDQSQCGIPKRNIELVKYFGMLVFTSVSGWLAFTQYHIRSDRHATVGPPFEYLWLPSLVLLAVYNLIGPLPRALGDLLGVQPGGYYFYKLKENDCLNPSFAMTSMWLLTTLAAFIQFGVFYLSFFDKVVEEGVKVPAAIVAIVPALFGFGQVVGVGGGSMSGGNAGNEEGEIKKTSARRPLQ